MLANEPPHGFRRMSRSVTVGRGARAFERASEGLRTWRCHDLVGLRVFPVATAPKEGDTVVVTLGSRYLSIAAPCRIEAVIDEADRYGFIYATLPGHPERGAESFMVMIADDGAVQCHIAAVSAPGAWATRIAGPLGWAIQSAATSGYLRSMCRYVQGGAGLE